MNRGQYHLLLFVLVILFSTFLFSYRILNNPPGLETDEGSISYNSILISKNLHDQNKRFMPFFILSSDHLDWKQPVLIYSTAIFFKIFGANLINFKLVNILYSLATVILIYILTRLLIKEKTFALIAMILYSISPMIIITTRIGNESILPAFFGTLWLVLLTLYNRNPKRYFLILCGFALGIGFYSFKGMRIIIPVWSLMTILLVLFKNKFNKKSFLDILAFVVTIIPYALIIPLLENKYPGSIFDRSSIPIENYRYYLHYWLANINVFSLFSQPDIGKIYGMDYFGALLISTLPLFICGVLTMIKKTNFQLFILITYFVTPILFGVAKSTSYSHRLTGLIPIYVLVTTFGVRYLYKKLHHSELKKYFLFLGIFLIAFNFLEFANYYYIKYPKQNSTKQAFDNKYYSAFKNLSEISTTKKLNPYVQSDIYFGHNDANRFFEQAYFTGPINIWKLGDQMPVNSVLLTQLSKLDNATNLLISLDSPDTNLLISNYDNKP